MNLKAIDEDKIVKRIVFLRGVISTYPEKWTFPRSGEEFDRILKEAATVRHLGVLEAILKELKPIEHAKEN